eukprot:6184096-Pleurochrysis_carterae.AAC.3
MLQHSAKTAALHKDCATHSPAHSGGHYWACSDGKVGTSHMSMQCASFLQYLLHTFQCIASELALRTNSCAAKSFASLASQRHIMSRGGWCCPSPNTQPSRNTSSWSDRAVEGSGQAQKPVCLPEAAALLQGKAK